MKTFIKTAALSVATIGLLAATAPRPEARHFALKKSVPEAGAAVAAPGEIRLWFTEAPEEGTVSIHLVEAEQVGVHAMDAAQDPDDATSFFVELHGTLPAGSYTVSWRGLGDDGHVARDDFSFTVTAQ